MPEDADLVARLQALDATLDSRDIVNTPRAQDAFSAKKSLLARTLSGLRNVDNDLAKPLAALADAEARRTPVVAALAEVERLIEDAPEWKTIRDNRERDREWSRQTDLLASRNALTKGVEYMGGLPCVPAAVRELLGVVVEHDGRQMPRWYGSVSELDHRIAEVGRKIASLRARHDAHRRDAEALLAEHQHDAEQRLVEQPVTTTS